MKRVLCLSGFVAVAAAISFTLFSGCGNESPVNPAAQSMAVSAQPADAASVQPMAVNKLARFREVIGIQNRHTVRLMKNRGIVGTATGLGPNGDPIILVFAKAEKFRNMVPASLDNVSVVVEVTGEFHALDNFTPLAARSNPAGGVSHTAKQTPPIKLGTSGGWGYDLANGYCCGGTLGSLITDGVKKYVLSNYHVFQSDIVSGGNNRVAQTGDPIIQPGLIDVNCKAANAQVVANLSALSFPASLPASNVDASIAEVVAGMVSDSILEIGRIAKATVAAAIGQAVKKSGRTTSLTRSTVSGLNATISVVYDNECAGGTAFTKKYTGQIVVQNRRSSFLNSGDSGSLMVEDKTTNPRAIGLLYAGSNTLAVANPINEVLSFFGSHLGSSFTMVGN